MTLEGLEEQAEKENKVNMPKGSSAYRTSSPEPYSSSSKYKSSTDGYASASGSEKEPTSVYPSGFKKKRRRRRKGSITILALITVMVLLISFIIYWVMSGKAFDTLPIKIPTQDPALTAPTEEPVVTLGEIQAWENPILKDSRFAKLFKGGTVSEEFLPKNYGITFDVFAGTNIITDFVRKDDLGFRDPIAYQQVPGVLTFRGNNFRNAPSYGFTTMKDGVVEQIWERAVGGMKSSKWDFSWSGTGWTGQPVIIKWPDDIKQMMNINAEKKAKANLVEVIYATMDGNIYFFDIDDGKTTRPPINIKAPIKGTPALDPRGYPILYVGQGDKGAPGAEMTQIGMRIFNLIDQSLLTFINGDDPMAFRTDWGACDSSPIVDAKTDTMIWASENGIIYTAKLNTKFDKAAKSLTISPEFTNMRYKFTGSNILGVEGSPSFYGQSMFFSDNSGMLSCVDLKTMKHVWIKPLDDDTDVTPVISQEESGVYLYTGTEVDYQQKITGIYKGNAYVYKIDALSGKTIWRNTYECYTKNDEANVGNDINGGVMGTPIVGKNKISNLVIYSFCMTNGIYSGNTLAAFDKESGQLLWDYKSKNYGWSSPVDVYDEKGNAYIIFPDSQSQVHILDGSTGKMLSVGNITMKGGIGGNVESSAAVYNDTLVIGTRRGVIVGLKLK